MMDTSELVDEVLNDLEEEKTELEHRIAFIQSIDWSKAVTEDEWHELCETSMRTSNLLSVLVKNIFPAAEDIKVGCNFVNFKLYGYKIQIPNSRCKGIYIATDWYVDTEFKKTYRQPAHREAMLNLKQYFDAKDNGLGWKIQAISRIRKSAYRNNLELFIKWFAYYRWKKIDRKLFEETWQNEEDAYALRTKHIEELEAENKKNLDFILNTLIPELRKFSSDHFSYYDGTYHRTIKDICEKENIPYPY